jgi:hypothetical protein
MANLSASRHYMKKARKEMAKRGIVVTSKQHLQNVLLQD